MSSFNKISQEIWNLCQESGDDLVHFNILKKEEFKNLLIGLLILRRMDCLLSEERGILAEASTDLPTKEIVRILSVHEFYNLSRFDLSIISLTNKDVFQNIQEYIEGYPEEVRHIIDNLNLLMILNKIDLNSDLLSKIIYKIVELNLTEKNINKYEMDSIIVYLHDFLSEPEEIDLSIDLISLMTKLTFYDSKETIKTGDNIVVSDYSMGIGSLLIEANNYLCSLNRNLYIRLQGQEINSEKYSLAKARMLLMGINTNYLMNNDCLQHVHSSLSKSTYSLMKPQHPSLSAINYYLESLKNNTRNEKEDNRFKGGLPTSQYSFYLYLQHIIYMMDSNNTNGSRATILSPKSAFRVLKGNHNKKLSKIREWILEEDIVETIIKLPKGLFYETGNEYYLWILNNSKKTILKEKIKFINGSSFFIKRGEKKDLKVILWILET